MQSHDANSHVVDRLIILLSLRITRRMLHKAKYPPRIKLALRERIDQLIKRYNNPL